jgi:hypothetical protein
MNLEIQEMDNPNIIILNDKAPTLTSSINKTSKYDNILSKMGMYVENGKITLTDQNVKHVSFTNVNTNVNTNKCDINNNTQCNKIKCARLQQSIKQQYQANNNPNPSPLITDSKNSYIYNKYFKNQPDEQETEKAPLTKEEIIQKLLQNRLQRQRIKQMKSTKLIMPTENIHFAPENNFNRLFGFSSR